MTKAKTLPAIPVGTPVHLPNTVGTFTVSRRVRPGVYRVICGPDYHIVSLRGKELDVDIPRRQLLPVIDHLSGKRSF
jgi:hypothetical protein